MGKVYDAIMGLVVGDDPGVPVDFHDRDTFEVHDIIAAVAGGIAGIIYGCSGEKGILNE